MTDVAVNWDDARTACQNIGGDLAIIDDCFKMTSIISYITEAGETAFIVHCIDL